MPHMTHNYMLGLVALILSFAVTFTHRLLISGLKFASNSVNKISRFISEQIQSIHRQNLILFTQIERIVRHLSTAGCLIKDIKQLERIDMSILSWDDFEDDSQNRLHLNSSLRPSSRKTANPQMVSDASNTSSNVAAAQPAAAPRSAGSNSTDSLARASASLDQLDVAPGLEELEMAHSVYRLMINV